MASLAALKIKDETFRPFSDVIAAPLAIFFNNLITLDVVPAGWCQTNIVPGLVFERNLIAFWTSGAI